MLRQAQHEVIGPLLILSLSKGEERFAKNEMVRRTISIDAAGSGELKA